MKRSIFGWLGVATLALATGCLPGGGGGGGGNDDGGVVPIGGQGGGAGGAGGGMGGGGCVPACVEGQQCGSDGCGGVCGTCDEGLRCIEGMCSDQQCPAGTVDCDGVCTEALTDPNNCGSCGNVCPTADGLVADCVAAECYLTCPEFRGQGVNVDINADAENCGSCGNECPAIGGAAVCGEGVCVDPCVEQGLVGCGEDCVDTQFDPTNCGECGLVCPTAEGGFPVCEAGQCGDPCQGQLECDGVCVDADNDPNNCGGCGVTCEGGQACAGGLCQCPDGGGLDLNTDVENCGECGNACPEIEGGDRACNAGNCADACGGELNECNGACVNLGEDPANCGSCGNDCMNAQVSDPPVRFWLEEQSSETGSLGCITGDCLFAVNRVYGFPNAGGVRETCDHVCAEAGARCLQQPVGIANCPLPDGGEAPLNENAVGCAVYQGVGSIDAQPVATCQDEITPRSGFGGDNRTGVSCFCEAVDPPVAMPPLGIGVPMPGRYQYETVDYEIVLMRVEVDTGVLQVETDQPGYVAIFDSEGNELDRTSELNFGVFLFVEGLRNGTHYVTYRTFPERAQQISFAVAW